MTPNLPMMLLRLRAQQRDSGEQVCPRCGRAILKPDLYTNALSRYAEGIYICDSCGIAEALLDYLHKPMHLLDWDAFRPKAPEGDYTTVCYDNALLEVEKEQLPFLLNLYERWLNEPEGADPKPYEHEAIETCKGLKSICFSPFAVRYQTADGTLVIDFNAENGSLLFSTALEDTPGLPSYHPCYH